MQLTFKNQLNAKTSTSFSLTLLPDKKPDDYLTGQTDQSDGKSMITSCAYDFPDNVIVIARFDSGNAFTKSEPGDISIEVHLGPSADLQLIQTAINAARMMAVDAGIDMDAADYYDIPPFSVIRH